jgi:hypothetical protein
MPETTRKFGQTAEAVRSTLDLLVQSALAVWEPLPSGTQGGRPSETLVLLDHAMPTPTKTTKPSSQPVSSGSVGFVGVGGSLNSLIQDPQSGAASPLNSSKGGPPVSVATVPGAGGTTPALPTHPSPALPIPPSYTSSPGSPAPAVASAASATTGGGHV